MRLVAVLLAMGLAACGGEGIQLTLESPLHSTGAAPETEARRLPASAFAHAFKGGGWWIVLDRAPDAKLARGESTLVELEYTAVVHRQVDERLLADDVLGWRGRLVHLLDQQGPRCTAVVERFAIVGRAGPYWPDQRRDSETDAAVAREVWERSEPVLAARVQPLSGACEGATWARAAETEAPLLAPATRPSTAVSRAALAALRDLPLYQKIDRSYREEAYGEDQQPVRRTGPWERFEGAAPSVELFRDPSGRSAVVVVSAYAGSFCEGFSGQMTALWLVSGEGGAAGDLQLAPLGAVGEAVTPLSAVDLEGDGLPEVLIEGGVINVDTSVGLDTLTVPSFVCPC